jgi:hypothetical protein
MPLDPTSLGKEIDARIAKHRRLEDRCALRVPVLQLAILVARLLQAKLDGARTVGIPVIDHQLPSLLGDGEKAELVGDRLAFLHDDQRPIALDEIAASQDARPGERPAGRGGAQATHRPGLRSRISMAQSQPTEGRLLPSTPCDPCRTCPTPLLQASAPGSRSMPRNLAVPGRAARARRLRCRFIPALPTRHLLLYQMVSFGSVGRNRSFPLAFRVGPTCPMGGEWARHAPSLR